MGYRFGSTALGTGLEYLSDSNSVVFDCSVGIWSVAPVDCLGSVKECVAHSLCLEVAGSHMCSDFACRVLASSCCGYPSVCYIVS